MNKGEQYSKSSSVTACILIQLDNPPKLCSLCHAGNFGVYTTRDILNPAFEQAIISSSNSIIASG